MMLLGSYSSIRNSRLLGLSGCWVGEISTPITSHFGCDFANSLRRKNILSAGLLPHTSVGVKSWEQEMLSEWRSYIAHSPR